MKKSKKIAQSPKDIVKKELGYIREKMKEDGYYDGRFRSKTYKNKKKYTRNKKHHLDHYMQLIQDL